MVLMLEVSLAPGSSKNYNHVLVRTAIFRLLAMLAVKSIEHLNV